jgi:hypothetical protein
MMRFGIVGTSGHASRVAAPVLELNPYVTLLGAAGSTPERSRQFAKQRGLPRSYRDLDQMLGDRAIDAVWICSPNRLHAGQVAQCAAVLVRLGENAIGLMDTSCGNASPGSRIEVYEAPAGFAPTTLCPATATVATHDGRTQRFALVEMLDTYSAEVADLVAAVGGERGIGADAAAGIAV